MPAVSQNEARKKDFYVVKNGNTGDVIKVVFPNGIQVGLNTENFNGKITLSNLSVAPDDTTNALYAVGGSLYFNGNVIGSGGGTVPGGLDTYVQFNDGGTTFGGDAGLTYNKTTDVLTVSGDILCDGESITLSSQVFG